MCVMEIYGGVRSKCGSGRIKSIKKEEEEFIQLFFLFNTLLSETINGPIRECS